MKNILIVSYFFPPALFVASNRPFAFASNFKNEGLFPTVLTRHWEGDENNWADMDRTNSTSPIISENPSFRLIQLPYFSRWYSYCKRFHRFPIVREMLHTLYLILGIFYPHESADECFFEYIDEYVKENDIDYLMVISSPLNIIKLGSIVSRRHKIPLIVDFRDLWDIEILRFDAMVSLVQRFKNFFYRFYIRRWLRQANLITSVTAPLLGEIAKLRTSAELSVIENGFEREFFDKNFDSVVQTEKFSFSVIGTLYPSQDLSIMIEGIKRFLKGKNLDDVRLNFIGTSVFPEVAEKLRSELPIQCLKITERIERGKALVEIRNSNVLYYPAWKGFKGIVSAKFYEYLASGKRILIAPGDDDIISRIVRETGTGAVANTTDEFFHLIENWFREWERQGFLVNHGIQEEILKYSRENQTRKLASAILSIRGKYE